MEAKDTPGVYRLTDERPSILPWALMSFMATP
jgi:hypothetical protein